MIGTCNDENSFFNSMVRSVQTQKAMVKQIKQTSFRQNPYPKTLTDHTQEGTTRKLEHWCYKDNEQGKG